MRTGDPLAFTASWIRGMRILFTGGSGKALIAAIEESAQPDGGRPRQILLREQCRRRYPAVMTDGVDDSLDNFVPPHQGTWRGSMSTFRD